MYVYVFRYCDISGIVSHYFLFSQIYVGYFILTFLFSTSMKIHMRFSLSIDMCEFTHLSFLFIKEGERKCVELENFLFDLYKNMNISLENSLIF